MLVWLVVMSSKYTEKGGSLAIWHIFHNVNCKNLERTFFPYKRSNSFNYLKNFADRLFPDMRYIYNEQCPIIILMFNILSQLVFEWPLASL